MCPSMRDKQEHEGHFPYVPDTSAILSGKIDLLSMDCVLPSGVVGEIRKGRMGRIMENTLMSLTVMSPKKIFMDKITTAAKHTGDLPYLSQVDMEILAVAMEVHGTVVSDDYSMQNVCSSSGINFMGCGIESITRNIKWGYVCKGCGTKFDKVDTSCRICGHKITRYPIDQGEL